MRKLYTFLFYLALPVVFIRLFWRSLSLPAYRKRWDERFGNVPFSLDQCIWVHAVSVGETIAAIPLIKALKVHYHPIPILVTTMTPTGADRVKTAFGESVYHTYLPYDLPSAVTNFLKKVNPKVAVVMETELWPNLIEACHKMHIPVCLMNARLSAKSAKGYKKILSLTRSMLKNIDVIAANSEADALRFIQLGALKENVMVSGNIKFDLELPTDLSAKIDSLRKTLGENRFVWVAASTHEGEEEIILTAHKLLREINPQALLILVPRHPDRFDSIAKLCEQHFQTVRRSKDELCDPETGVYLGDTMGELLTMYGASDVAFVGGSLIPRGGHNMLEAGALAKPVITGPHLFNFAEISELFVAANALIKVTDAKTLADQLASLMRNENERKSMGEAGKQVVDANRGALLKQLNVIYQMV